MSSPAVTARTTLRPAARPAPPAHGLLHRLFALLALRATRARLAEMDDHLLRDIGITRQQAQAEHDRPLWDAPAGWYR